MSNPCILLKPSKAKDSFPASVSSVFKVSGFIVWAALAICRPSCSLLGDEWVIYGLYNFPDVVVHVHNRWGQKVFFSEGYSVPWDGKRNGVDLPIATYYYVIELKDSGKVFNGTVTIKRWWNN